MLCPKSPPHPGIPLESVNLSLSGSKSIGISPRSEQKISEFPNISISVHSSYDKSDEIAYIKGKNVEIFQALSSKVSKLKKNSEKILDSCLEEKSLEQNPFQACPNCSGQSFDAKNTNLESLKIFVNQVKSLKSTLNGSKQNLNDRMESVKKISDENEMLKCKIEEITVNLGKTLIDSSSESIGCSCGIF
jgi:methyl-accepting chemotaxis protein